MKQLSDYLKAKAEELLDSEGYVCPCGKIHRALPLRFLRIGSGVIGEVPSVLQADRVRRPFVIMDPNTAEAAGDQLLSLLKEAGIPYRLQMLYPEEGTDKILPNDHFIEVLAEAFDPACDFILGCGGGVINDLSKYLAHDRGLQMGIVGTAPSMDGYASNSSSMELSGVKTTVYTTCPEVVILDTDILKDAPYDMIRSGFGDMAAKIISISDWRLAHEVTGEYYCENIASFMLRSCNAILDNAGKIQKRDPEAIGIMAEGLVLSGIMSSFAQQSRPASGMEHTVSHLLEMFAMARGQQPDHHGLQVGYGTRAAFRLYRAAAELAFDREQAFRRADAFDETAWEAQMQEVFGNAAGTIIANALSEKRNEPASVRQRIESAFLHMDRIRELIRETSAAEERVSEKLDLFAIADTFRPEEMGYTKEEAYRAICCNKDLRARYIFTSFLSDMGVLADALASSGLQQLAEDAR